jgi:hypothetical protein
VLGGIRRYKKDHQEYLRYINLFCLTGMNMFIIIIIIIIILLWQYIAS